MYKVDSQLKKRVMSFIWRGGMMALATFIAYLADNVGLLELSPSLTVIVGLIFGEISKYLNTKSV